MARPSLPTLAATLGSESVPSALTLAVLQTVPSVHQIRLPSEVPTTPLGASTPTALPTLVTDLPSAEMRQSVPLRTSSGMASFLAFPPHSLGRVK